MRINHNIAALNTYRQLSANTVNTSRSLEKLSSGLRINRAGDDAAGLAISEKMRSQIRGLDTAARNANDGISLIQTAEGALNETHSILQRMKELAVQAANDTNTAEDRAEIQKEIDQLKTEVTRIAEQTEFNTKPLLDGSMSIFGKEGLPEGITSVNVEGEHVAKTYSVEIEFDADSVGTSDLTFNNPTLAAGEYTYTITKDPLGGSDHTLEIHDSSGNLVTDAGINFDSSLTFDSVDEIAGSFTIKYKTAVKDESDSTVNSVTVTLASNFKPSVNGGEYEAININIDTSKAMKFHIGANSTQNTSLSINNMGAKSLGVDTLNLETQEEADAAITTIDNAISKVSSQRAALGAMQNRLEHTINNLGTAAENLTAAESRIRDVDMAKEMMEFTKNSILSQASQAMLAQANLQPQSVLHLLQ